MSFNAGMVRRKWVGGWGERAESGRGMGSNGAENNYFY